MASANAIKVMVVCTNSIIKSGICKILSENNYINIIDELIDGTETINAICQINPDIALIDYNFSEFNGIELARNICKTTLDIKVVLFSNYSFDQTNVTRALEAGVSAILDNSSACDELLVAIKAASSGQLYLTPAISSKVFWEMNGRASEKIAKRRLSIDILSEREREVMQLIAEGFTSPQIAERLFISQKTVRNHRANLMNKLGLHGIAEIVKYAIKTNIVNINI